ncbi:MAG: YihY/virulence factor BrkB family protein [Bacteroidota bacterium]|nr:MAG: YihY/virulence factor BrkB family protein [Bacteroidota bacterium]
MLTKYLEIFNKEYWLLNRNDAPVHKRFLLKQIRIMLLAIKGFTEDRVQVRASALTYYTLLSIVPIAAMVFGIAQAFGFEETLRQTVMDSFKSQQEVSNYILNFADKYLSNISGGVLAGVGVLVLLWTVMRLLSSIELSFNDIWRIKKSRAMARKMSDYISLVIIGPVLVVASFSINIFLEQQVASSSEAFPLIGYIGPILGFFLSLVPFVFIWVVFMLVYIVMPNTKVKLSSALIAGVLGGSLFQLFQLLYISFQSKLFNYGEVYGSFAALPLFLIWMQVSWLIVLFGAELAFANQNVEHYETESESLKISNHLKITITMLVVRAIALNFRQSQPPLTSDEIAHKLDLPVRLVRDVLYELNEVGIVSETITKNVKQNAYQPSTDTDRLSVSYVMNAINRRGNDHLISPEHKEVKQILQLVDSFYNEIEKSPKNKLLIDL